MAAATMSNDSAAETDQTRSNAKSPGPSRGFFLRAQIHNVKDWYGRTISSKIFGVRLTRLQGIQQ